jgi:hypothetical protein
MPSARRRPPRPHRHLASWWRCPHPPHPPCMPAAPAPTAVVGRQ